MSLNKITQAIWIMLIVSIPLMPKISNILLLSILLLSIPKFKDYSKISKKLFQPEMITLFILILFWIVQGLLSSSISETKYGLMPLLLAIPVLAFFSSSKKSILIGFILSGIVSGIRAFWGWIVAKNSVGGLDLFEGDKINLVLGMERPYLGFLQVLAGISALWFWREKHQKRFLALFILYFFTTGFFSARISFISFVIISAFFLWHTWKLGKTKKILLVLSTIALLTVVVSQSESLKKRLFLTSTFEHSVEKFKHHEPRVIIWDCAFQIAKHDNFNSFFGIPSENELDERLGACYTQMENQHRANYFKTEKLNVHSQFIAVFLTSGSIGLLLWLVFWGFITIKSSKDWILICFSISLLLFCIFEVLLRRQMGSYLFALTITLILTFSEHLDVRTKQNKSE